MRLEGLVELKNLTTSSRLEPETFKLVAQRFNHLRCRVLRVWRCRKQQLIVFNESYITV
jgi:hypothetical protein